MQIERAACLQALETEGNGDEADSWSLFSAQVDSSFKVQNTKITLFMHLRANWLAKM